MYFNNKPIGKEKFCFSACGQYRYKRWEKWSNDPPCVFVMRNPVGSTGNGNDSRTMDRCREIARNNNIKKCGGIITANLCAMTGDWDIIKNRADKVEEQGRQGINKQYIENVINTQDALVVAAWGCYDRRLRQGVAEFKTLARQLKDPTYCLDLLAHNQPRLPVSRGFSYSGNLYIFPLY